ncbi:MAG: NAD(P)H-dependent oxidoreductase subunit E [Planctomycetota bacterium]
MSDNGKDVRSPLPDERVRWWEERCTHFPERRAVLLPLLHDIQDHAGCLDRDGMTWAARFVGISPVEVYGVATFYWMYDLEPRPRFKLSVCHNISCDLRGKDAILDVIEEELGIRPGHHPHTEGEFCVRTVECMGACSTAPMMEVNGRYFEALTPDKARAVLRDLKDGREPASTTPWDTELRPALPAALPTHPGERLAWRWDHAAEEGR